MILGTAVKISSETNIQGDSATIDIYDPEETKLVDGASMTDAGNRVYEYIFQSTDAMESGEFCAIISVVKGSYTAMSNIKFVLELPCD